MDFFKLHTFTNGWIVGDFEPSIIRTKNFEFGVKKYRMGDIDERHVHKIAEEITVIISGKYKINDRVVGVGDVIAIHPNESAQFSCLEDGATAVIKTPSVIGDKYEETT